ncbi:MAG: iron-containing alcohol dehydrogenase [Acidobacteria bacterium]|nr:iron-containing alcohol dehydrogenase [Acidobacteriota bacterium]
MHVVSCVQPRRLIVGSGALDACAPHLIDEGAARVTIISGPRTSALAAPLVDTLQARGVETRLWNEIGGEPTVSTFERALHDARAFRADTVVGIGGGSPLDVAKLVAGMLDDPRHVSAIFGSGTLARRRVRLALIPTTAGTGSEVSPNAILLDDVRQLKLAVISPHLVPDATFIDPLLACGLPPDITAATGIDALTHCIEAYANRHAHPMVDEWALAGVRLIATHLERASHDGLDLAAREALALGSLYGGLCLGPVNTAAVHALAYPLGGLFRVGHGLANALMLPHVLRCNLDAAPARYASIAVALGAASADAARSDPHGAGAAGFDALDALARACRLPAGLGTIGIPRDAIPQLTESALTVRRLLDNNPRNLTREEIVGIYERAFG